MPLRRWNSLISLMFRVFDTVLLCVGCINPTLVNEPNVCGCHLWELCASLCCVLGARKSLNSSVGLYGRDLNKVSIKGHWNRCGVDSNTWDGALRSRGVAALEPTRVVEILKDRLSWYRDCRVVDVLNVLSTGNGESDELLYMQMDTAASSAQIHD